ncbi:MAG: thioredoxin family protein [Telluria sp.]
MAAPGDVDWFSGAPAAAFAQARASGRPVFLYWGASWCPPCNRIRAGAFARADFAELSQSFIALHIDGDGPGAQELAEQFRLRSYPTLVVYRPDGTEVTRLPCELSPKSFVETLALALRARFTVAESLSAALSRERSLSDDEWRLLSFYSWDTDEQQVLKNLDFAAALASMTRACSYPGAALRLDWHALHAAAMGGKAGIDQRAVIARISAALADPAIVCAQMDLVITYSVDLVRFLTEPRTAERAAFAQAWAAALGMLESDTTLWLPDQLSALRARVRMARLGAPDDGLEQHARSRSAQAFAAPVAPALRHALLNTAAGVLSDACLFDEAEALLESELDRSHSPFYFMHNLAAIAKKRGDAVRAVDWYEQAWNRATGPATRLQWGASYLQGLGDFTPQDADRIDRLSGQIMDELSGMPDAACQRNRTQVQRIAAKLGVWRGDSKRADALRQAARQIAG